MAGFNFEISFQQSVNAGGWPAPDVPVIWNASPAVQNIGPYPHWRPGGTGAIPIPEPLNPSQNRTTGFEATLEHMLIKNGNNTVEAWEIEFSEPMNPRDFGIGFDFGGTFDLEWSNNNEMLTITFADGTVADGQELNMWIMRLRDDRPATGNSAAQMVRVMNEPIHHSFTIDGGNIGQTNREILFETIVEAENIIQANYTPITWARMQSSLVTARNIYNNQTATDAQIDEAIVILRNSLNSLVQR
jgi:hypothetical protein